MSKTQSYISKVFYEDDDCRVTLEQVDGHLMAHVALFKFSKSVYKKLLDLWKDLLNRAYWQGYESIYSYTKDDKIPRFFPGSKIIGEYNWKGEPYKVVQWELK